MTVQSFRKRPVEIEAVQWTGGNADEIKAWVGDRDNGECRFLLPDDITGAWQLPHVYDELQQTWVAVNDSDWIIKGVRGEFYPCAADVFTETYEWSGASLVRTNLADVYRNTLKMVGIDLDQATIDRLVAEVMPDVEVAFLQYMHQAGQIPMEQLLKQAEES